MNDESELRDIAQLFEALLPLTNSEREVYLAARLELSSDVVEHTRSLLRADEGNLPLPSLAALLQTPRR